MKNLFLFLLSLFPLIILLNLFMHNKSILLILLSLEILRLSIILLFTIINFIIETYNIICLIILLRIGACEARIGLCILVSIVRFTGSDYTLSLNLSKC